MLKSFVDDLPHYLALMRVEKPIGWLLLLWPTLWALWIASDGTPCAHLLWVFVLGVFVMRSAGCVINDFADRNIDPLVERTQQRPLAAGLLTPKKAILLFVALSLIALALLLTLPARVWPWSIPAIAVTIFYPFMKRFIQAPQMVLGIAFSFSIPMAYVAVGKSFDLVFYLLILANFLWVLIYDTAYAMSDREDDLKIGVKSTAIWFGENDKRIICILQIIFLVLWLVIMQLLNLKVQFLIAWLIVLGLFAYQQWLIKDRQRVPCFTAFLNNGWVGGILWFGLVSTT